METGNTQTPAQTPTRQPLNRDSEEVRSTFLRLPEDGDAVVVALLGRPHHHAVYWDGTTYRPFDQSAREQGARRLLRLGLNVAVCEIERVDQQPAMRIVETKIWEVSQHLFYQLRSITRLFRAADWLYLVERVGQRRSKETRYLTTPVYNLSQQDYEALRGLELYDLYELFGEDTTGRTQAEPVTITSQEQETLTSKLNETGSPEETRQLLCNRFGVGSISDLPREQLKFALDFIENLATTPANPFD